jgi:hypothetical protein
VLDVLASSKQGLAVEDVLWIFRRLKRIVPDLKRQHRVRLLYHRGVFNDLVAATLVLRGVFLQRG